MKKKIIIFGSILLLLFTGCTTNNSPSKKVEEFMSKYQSMDSEVLTQLDSVVSSEATMSDEQKKEYKALMEKQYQNLSYKIKNENIDGDRATVDVEIEVYDFATSINKSKKYYDEHKDEFKDEKATINTNDNTTEENPNAKTGDKDNDVTDTSDNADSVSSYIDYKIKELKDVTEKVKYTITFNLTKNDNDEWEIEDISDDDRKKIHGLFEQ